MNYTIKKGDTIWDISRKFNVDSQELMDANHIVDPDEIYAGTKLTIPGATNTTSTPQPTTAPTISKPTYTAPTYTAPTYKESDIVTQAKNALDTQLAQKPGAYQSQWQNQLNDVIGKILNREKFSYDLNGDALYQQYKDKYIKQGKLAMGDAIGQASAMTGGYGNSYAQSVGQQMYQKEMQNLNDIVPELWQMAYDKHNQEGQDLYNQFAMLGERENLDYGRYRDEVADWLTERDYLAGRYDSERDFDYSKFTDNRDFGYGSYRDSMSDYQWQTALDYQKDRDEVADSQWQKEYDLAAGKVVGTTEVEDTDDPPYTYEPSTAPIEEEEEVEVDVDATLNGLIAKGANKSQINNQLRLWLKDGAITTAEYQALKNQYAPRGNTY